MGWFFFFFFVSGFCSILYEIVWLRLAMAQFGVTSALVSIVLSMFMAGLGLGSWASGYILRKYRARIRIPPLRLYGLIELLIGTSALAVPLQLSWGRHLLDRIPVSSSWGYYLISGAWVAPTLIPWCACMGATIPVAMLAIKNTFDRETSRSFSFLYLANVLGAVIGAIVPLLLIEIYGFHGTLRVGAILNGLLFISASVLSLGRWADRRNSANSGDVASKVSTTQLSSGVGTKPLVLLFLTGLTSMGAEVIWIRQFTPYLGTVVYAFAAILFVYLIATFVGSRVYRLRSRRHRQPGMLVWMLGVTALLPVLTASPQFHMPDFHESLMRLALGIGPFSALLGFVTPMLVDRWSGGDPDRAGSAYAVNVLGCILGPLISGFILLPLISDRWVLFTFALPWLFIGVLPGWSLGQEKTDLPLWQRALPYGITAIALVLIFTVKSFEDQFGRREVLRDNTATVIATGEGMTRRLLVNGVGITYLTPMTKVMAHLPLAFLDRAPRNALVVCFGMGTTYRSLMSWNIATTAVELVPSVPRLFWFYHADAPDLLVSPRSRVVIDDGRRYLERSREQYDVITIDPPPPVEAAGTSMLYSKEFYAVIGRRLTPDGILQQWLPRGDAVVQAAVARAVSESFPYVRVFHSFDDRGFHFLASNQPIAPQTALALADRMPATAAADFVEWGPERLADDQFGSILRREISLDQMISGAPQVPALQDDRPENEYFILRGRLPESWLSWMKIPH
jgi:spermidine synthase